MQRQILWSKENPRRRDIWQDLEANSKKAFIVALARVIAKAACPSSVSKIKEASHDR